MNWKWFAGCQTLAEASKHRRLLMTGFHPDKHTGKVNPKIENAVAEINAEFDRFREFLAQGRTIPKSGPSLRPKTPVSAASPRNRPIRERKVSQQPDMPVQSVNSGNYFENLGKEIVGAAGEVLIDSIRKVFK